MRDASALILRPEPGATVTAMRARARGIRAVTAPLFVVMPVPWTPPEDAVDALMMTSANAARHGGAGLARYRRLPLHAVGGETAAAARAAGFTDVRVGGPDAAALVAALGDGGTVLHLAGREHRAPLPAGGIRRIVYAADAVATLPEPARAALDDGAIALLHSARAAGLFRALVTAAGLPLATIPVAALGPAVAAAAGPGWRGVASAATPDDDALLAAAFVRDRICD